ncbi:MAG: hypothetical protein IK015_09000 [Treponema sp.]|nr:hypothetical protein [Treponema sp.]
MKKIYSSLFIGLFSLSVLFADGSIVCKMKPLEMTSQKVGCFVTTAEKNAFFYLVEGDVSSQLKNDFAQKPKKYDKTQGILELSSVKDKILQKVAAQKPFTNAVVEIEKNGVYTVCAEDKKGDVCFSVVQVSNIDKTPPSKISEFTCCSYENGQRAFFWNNPSDEDFAGSTLRIVGADFKQFDIPKDVDHIIIDDVDQNAKCLIVANDDVGNVSEPAELSGLVMRAYIKSLECGHKVDETTYEEFDSVYVEVKGFDLICCELEDFELTSDTLKFKNLKLLHGDERCLLSFDRPEEKGEYSFSVRVKTLTDVEEKTFNISSGGTKPIPVEFSLSNSSIGSRSDKNQSLTIKGYNLDKLNLKALTVCWKEGKDDIVTGRKKLNGDNSLTVEYSYGGIDNYPDKLSISGVWEGGRELVVKYGSEVIWTKEIDLNLQPVLKANGVPLPEWVGECRFDDYGFFRGGDDTINDEFLRTPGKGNKVSFSFSNNILTVYATYSHPDLKADEYNLKVDIKVDKARKRAVILYYRESWKNYLGNWEHDEVVSRDNDDVQRAWAKLMVDRHFIYKEKE